MRLHWATSHKKCKRIEKKQNQTRIKSPWQVKKSKYFSKQDKSFNKLVRGSICKNDDKQLTKDHAC